MERLFLGQACGGAGSGVERARGKPVVIESAAGTVLVLGNVSDPMGGILLKTPSGAAINITASGITINNGQGATGFSPGALNARTGTSARVAQKHPLHTG